MPKILDNGSATFNESLLPLAERSVMALNHCDNTEPIESKIWRYVSGRWNLAAIFHEHHWELSWI